VKVASHREFMENPDQEAECLCWCGRRTVFIDRKRIGVDTESCGHRSCHA
jgi:hypothetical protein